MCLISFLFSLFDCGSCCCLSPKVTKYAMTAAETDYSVREEAFIRTSSNVVHSNSNEEENEFNKKWIREKRKEKMMKQILSAPFLVMSFWLWLLLELIVQ